MKLKSLPRQLGYILGAQWTRDLSWTIFTILLARRSPEMLGQIAVALSCGYLAGPLSGQDGLGCGAQRLFAVHFRPS